MTDVIHGYKDLCTGLYNELTHTEQASCIVDGNIDAQRVFDFFRAVYEEVPFGDATTRILLKKAEHTECICGVSILYNYFLEHRLRPDARGIIVGSVCIQHFDGRLTKDIEWTSKVTSGDKLCKFCHRRNVNGDHDSCTRRAEEAADARLRIHLSEFLNQRDHVYYIDVPFTDKASVKALGAKWDAPHRLWYAPTFEVAKQLYARNVRFIHVEDTTPDPEWKPWRYYHDRLGDVYYFNVKFEDKDVAKSLGARWDPDARNWLAATATVVRALLARGFEFKELPPTIIQENGSWKVNPSLYSK